MFELTKHYTITIIQIWSYTVYEIAIRTSKLQDTSSITTFSALQSFLNKKFLVTRGKTQVSTKLVSARGSLNSYISSHCIIPKQKSIYVEQDTDNKFSLKATTFNKMPLKQACMKKPHQKNAFLVFNTFSQKQLHSYFKLYSGIPLFNHK